MLANLLDANGVLVTVGATVKLVGTVVSVNAGANRFHEVVIQVSHPLPASAGAPKDINGFYTSCAEVNPPGYRVKTIGVPAGVLIVGS